jgi:hypothetical protein
LRRYARAYAYRALPALASALWPAAKKTRETPFFDEMS